MLQGLGLQIYRTAPDNDFAAKSGGQPLLRGARGDILMPETLRIALLVEPQRRAGEGRCRTGASAMRHRADKKKADLKVGLYDRFS
jgi:hypothetical protein